MRSMMPIMRGVGGAMLIRFGVLPGWGSGGGLVAAVGEVAGGADGVAQAECVAVAGGGFGEDDVGLVVLAGEGLGVVGGEGFGGGGAGLLRRHWLEAPSVDGWVLVWREEAPQLRGRGL